MNYLLMRLSPQYFNSGPNFASDIASSVGSNVVLTDFCPFHDVSRMHFTCTCMYCISYI